MTEATRAALQGFRTWRIGPADRCPIIKPREPLRGKQMMDVAEGVNT
jgi:hypothetical protein